MGKTYTSCYREFRDQTGVEIIEKTIILGIGNLLLGDEGVGIHIINKLKKLKLPSNVELIDGATGGFSLIPIFEKYKNDTFIIVDAIKVLDEQPVASHESSEKKGDLYLIPLDKLYSSITENYKNPGFISFHQTAISDVLILMLGTLKIKIRGYFLGINILEPFEELDLKKHYSMQLSPEIKDKIKAAIEIIKKHI